MKTIIQAVKINAPAHDVYEAFMDSRKHAEFTGGTARISRKVGGSFSVFDKYASGKNLELTQDKRIVQSWRAEDWPEGKLSKITITLKEARGVTTLGFKQTGVPDPFYRDISQGWKGYYWKPLKKMLEKR
jgi:activator of HSP90 ATPase